MKKQLIFFSVLYIVLISLTGCMKKPMACCEVPATGSKGQSITFNSTCSMNAEKFEWDFGDGAKSANATATHIYTAAGTFTVKLTVTDMNGEKPDEVSQSIKIN